MSFVLARLPHSARGRLVTMLAAILMGAMLEEAQHLLYRFATLEWYDLIFDSMGTICGTSLAIFSARRFIKVQSS